MNRFCSALSRAQMVTLLLLAGLPATATFAITYQTVALSGDQAPGMPEGVTFSDEYQDRDGVPPFALVSLNNAGQVAFKAYLEGAATPVADTIGVWTGAAGNLSLAAQTGQPAPGLPGETLQWIAGATYLTLNDAGELAFYGRGSAGHLGYWTYGPSGLQLLAAEGQPAPDVPEGSVFDDVRPLSLPKGTVFNGRSEFALKASFDGPAGSGGGYWVGQAGALHQVTNPKPVLGGRLNDVGQLGVAAKAADGRYAVFVGTPGGSWSTIAAVNDPAPGTPEGAVFAQLQAPSINDRGQIVWYGTAKRSTPEAWTGTGLWIGDTEGVDAIAVSGQPVPGLASGTVFKNFSTTTIVNATGRTAFWATVGSGTSETTSLWQGSRSGLSLIASQDQPLPGTDAGWSTLTDFYSPSMNAAGQVAFQASPGSRGLGIWATNPLGELVSVAVPGQPWELADGENKVVKEAEMVKYAGTGGEDGMARPINDAGWVAFVLHFTDGTYGAFTADTNVPGVTAGILTGRNRRGEVVGDTGAAGHVAVTFPTVEAGIFKGYFHSGPPEDGLAAAAPDLLAPPLGLDNLQLWDLSFTGKFEDALLELTYQQSLLPPGLDESLLAIYQQTPLGWQMLGGSVDPLTNTILLTTPSFGTFALGLVPEPTAAAMLLLGVGALALRIRRG